MSKKRDWNEVVRVRPRQGRAEFLRLDMNENPEGLPKAFHRKVLRQITPGFLSMYPEPERLILELSRSLGVSSQSLFLSNGSDESIKSIFEVFGEPGKKVVTVAPTFEMYGVYAKMFQMVHCPVSYSQGMFLDLEAILAAIDGETSLVSVLNPNNPIGTVFSVAEVRRIIDKAREVGALVILDEAYHYFYDQTFLGLVSEYDHVLLTRTFSKLCSIAGLRIGYTVGNPSLIALLEKVRQTFNVNSVALLYATEILSSYRDFERLREKEGNTFWRSCAYMTSATTLRTATTSSSPARSRQPKWRRPWKPEKSSSRSTGTNCSGPTFESPPVPSQP